MLPFFRVFFVCWVHYPACQSCADKTGMILKFSVSKHLGRSSGSLGANNSTVLWAWQRVDKRVAWESQDEASGTPASLG